MQKGQKRRLGRVKSTIATAPLRQAVVDRAFARFREYGELPEEERIADAVCRRALQRDHEKSGVDAVMDALYPDRPRLVVVQPGAKPEEPSVRECVFHEAVYGTAMVRKGARLALMWEVDKGADPTDRSFLADRTLPDFAAVGLSLLGFPERLAKPPYEEQAHRLFARQDDIRRRSPEGDAHELWLENYVDAAVQFSLDGTLPHDQLLAEAVLSGSEFEALMAHYRGEDVAEVMAAFDRLALADDDDERDDALDAVVAIYMARARAGTS